MYIVCRIYCIKYIQYTYILFFEYTFQIILIQQEVEYFISISYFSVQFPKVFRRSSGAGSFYNEGNFHNSYNANLVLATAQLYRTY